MPSEDAQSLLDPAILARVSGLVVRARMIVVVVNLEVKVEAGGGGKQLACPRGRAPT